MNDAEFDAILNDPELEAYLETIKPEIDAYLETIKPELDRWLASLPDFDDPQDAQIIKGIRRAEDQRARSERAIERMKRSQ